MDLGAQLREARLGAGLTITEMAARAGLTPSHISQIERGVANPSIGALNRICQVTGIRMGTLFFSNESPEPSPPPAESLVGIVRHNYRRTLIPPGSPIHHELLTPDLQHSMEIFKSYVPPGADLGDTPVSHVGEEWIMVLKGTLELTVGGESHVLKAGDAAYFYANAPHSWKNLSQEELELIWVATPPHF